jgi:(heptosyl)LPS beta-1,4-glucosyltransferase
MTPPACKLSVTIIARNEEARIGDCLASVRWADEIIVVDTGSVDRTIEICHKYTPHVASRSWQGYAPAKNAALELATGDWLLSLDADERVSDALRQEIVALQQQPMASLAAGYAIPRRNYLWGRWLRYGGLSPDYQIRLFKRGKGTFKARRVHESVVVDGPVERLQHPIQHYSYQGIGDVIQRLERYTDLAALDLRDQGQPFRVSALVLRPLGRFLRNYILKQGFRDGTPGLIMAVSYAYSVFVREAKLWEMTQSHRPGREYARFDSSAADGRDGSEIE